MNAATVDIEAIVRGVLAQLGGERAPEGVSAAAGMSRGSAGTIAPAGGSPTPVESRHGSAELVTIAERVITQEVLAAQVRGAERVRIAPKAIVTPAARDWLRAKKVETVREALESPLPRGGVRWEVIVSTPSPLLKGALEGLSGSGLGIQRHLSGTAVEAAREGVSALCRGEAVGVVVFSQQPEVVACVGNRNSQVRAAVALSIEQVNAVKKVLGPNLLAVSPVGRQMYELRNLLKAYVDGGAPQPPEGW